MKTNYSSSRITLLCAVAIAALSLDTSSVARIPERSPVFFIATAESDSDSMDLTSYPEAPEVSFIPFRGTTFYARMSTTFRLISKPDELHVAQMNEDRSSHLYCRIPQSLTQDEYREILVSNVLENTDKVQRAQAGIHDVLQALDCFEGDGDSTYRSPPTLYRYCPHGKLTILPSRDQTATSGGKQPLDETTEDYVPTLHDYGQFEGSDDKDSSTLVGWYNASQPPQWNIELEQWELPLAAGGLCTTSNASEQGSMRLSAKLVFRCHAARNSGKTTWLIFHEEHSCDYVVEMETSAVCDWHTAIANVYKCPIPCLVV